MMVIRMLSWSWGLVLLRSNQNLRARREICKHEINTAGVGCWQGKKASLSVWESSEDIFSVCVCVMFLFTLTAFSCIFQCLKHWGKYRRHTGMTCKMQTWGKQRCVSLLSAYQTLLTEKKEKMRQGMKWEKERVSDHVRGWREIIEVREIELIRDIRGEMEWMLDF